MTTTTYIRTKRRDISNGINIVHFLSLSIQSFWMMFWRPVVLVTTNKTLFVKPTIESLFACYCCPFWKKLGLLRCVALLDGFQLFFYFTILVFSFHTLYLLLIGYRLINNSHGHILKRRSLPPQRSYTRRASFKLQSPQWHTCQWNHFS